MPLLVLTGFPGSGKTTLARLLEARLRSSHPEFEVAVVSDPAPPPGRLSGYADSHVEKATRAQVKSEVERKLLPSVVVICDSLNYIKGFRYELYCIARSAGTRHCVVWCRVDAEVAARRSAEATKYEEGVVDGLVGRYEAPDANNRWDSPLFITDEGSETNTESLGLDLDAVVGTLFEKGRKLIPVLSTKQPVPTKTNLLHELDRATLQVEECVVERLPEACAGDNALVRSGGARVLLHRLPSVAELKRTRRAYLKLHLLNPPSAQNYGELVDGYAHYLSAHLRET